jgi:hypothetical protein
MGKSMKGKKINNNVLEVIMRDVLYGMSDFTRDASRGSQLGDLEITAVENEGRRHRTTARILPFSDASKTPAKK